MYIAESSLLLLDNPFLYSTEGLINSEQQIEEIFSQGYKEAVVDLDRSYKEWAVLYGDSTEKLFHSFTNKEISKSLSPPPSTPLAEELPKASALYTEALVSTQRIMKNFKTNGILDVKAGSIVVEEIMGSVLRNASALQALSKLRNQDDYTFSHCVNVAMLTVMLARHLGGTDAAPISFGDKKRKATRPSRLR